MILSGDEIRKRNIISPFCERTVHESGKTFGVGPAGYDIRIAQEFILFKGSFELASTVEHFTMPNDVVGFVYDKSTYARLGLSLFNTVLEPGWTGFLTLELSFVGPKALGLRAGDPIAQIIFQRVEGSVIPYRGKYQNQKAGPQAAILER